MTPPLGGRTLEVGRTWNEVNNEELGIESIGDGTALVGRVDETEIDLLRRFGCNGRRRRWGGVGGGGGTDALAEDPSADCCESAGSAASGTFPDGGGGADGAGGEGGWISARPTSTPSSPGPMGLSPTSTPSSTSADTVDEVPMVEKTVVDG